MLALHPQKSIVNKTIADLIASGEYQRPCRLISIIWILDIPFHKSHFGLAGRSLLKVFPAKVSGLGQDIYNELMAIKNFRNQLLTMNISSILTVTRVLTQDSYNLIVRYVNFLEYSESSLFLVLMSYRIPF